MENVKAQFLKIIGDHIADRKTDMGNISEELCLYADQHQLSPIIYFQTKTPSFVTSYHLSILSYVNRKNISDSLLEKLREKGITAFLIKGDKIASYYTEPSLRISSDCDIVVSDLESAHEIMLDNGFQNISKFAGREWQYMKDVYEFELHDRLVFDEAINETKITEFLNNFWPYVKDNTLDINFHFVYILAHLRKHFMNAGVGFRQFLDIAMMEKNCFELNWDWIENTLEEIGMLKFTQTVLSLIERWWGVCSPIRGAEISDEFLEDATDHIFKNGLFGSYNPENKDYLAANQARKESRGIVALKVLFPGYEELCKIPAFSFVRGKPALLPIVWIYRILRAIKRGNVDGKVKVVSGKFVSKDYVEQREEMFRQWGL